MALAAFSVRRSVFTRFAILLFAVAGFGAYFTLGQLEDPEYTVKTAVIVTPYPLASPEQVEQEVTDVIELEIQKLSEVDHIESYSSPGLSRIKVQIRPQYLAKDLPQVWDKLRAKVRNVESRLPPGAGRPEINDEFGDVYGHLVALVSDGFPPAEMERYAKDLKRELSLIEGVAKVDLWGVQERRVYIDTIRSRLEQLGISENTIARSLQAQNAIVDAGWVDVVNRRIPIIPSGEFRSPEEIGDLPIRPSAGDVLRNPDVRLDDADNVLAIRDIGKVYEGYVEPPVTLMRFNGQPAITIAISNRPGVNIVEMGRRLDRKLREMQRDLPVGIELERVHWQSAVVEQAVSAFLINFLEAVAIVVAVLALAMGWRMGVVIGSALVVTVLVTFLVMAIADINLQRMSLGALVIALGMMVDNAIVVADGYVARVRRGMPKEAAAIEAADQPAMPLLGATIIAVMAFYPIFASEESAGEYTQTLFTVVAISLLASWLVSVTLTPLQCITFLRTSQEEGEGDAYGGRFYGLFRAFLEKAIRFRLITILAAVGVLVASTGASRYVNSLFFPDSSMSKFMIDFWAPQGTRIEYTSAKLREIEERLLADERVDNVATYVGAGPPRFYLPVEPEANNPAYGQLVVNMKDYRQIDTLADELQPWFAERFPDAEVFVRKFTSGPGNTWKFEMRISGPASATGDSLRREADKLLAVLRESPVVGPMETDWRQRTLRIVPAFDAVRARWSGVTRPDVANTIKRAFDGTIVGLYREKDDLIPIVLRYDADFRQRIGSLDVLPVQPEAGIKNVPLAQVVRDLETDLIDPIIYRYNRLRTITVRANPVLGVTLPTLQASIAEGLAKLELSPGYRMEWGGEAEDSAKAQKSLIPGAVPAAAVMLLVMFALFNNLRTVLSIVLVVPFAAIGVILGLALTGVPFGFVALLGAMSLSGMMIKNGIVLLDQIAINREQGMSHYEAIVDAALSRLRPVMLAAATTVLGVIPLLQDVFWVGLAVVIMVGLTVGTVLTMIVLPVIYATLNRVRREPAAAAVPPAGATTATG